MTPAYAPHSDFVAPARIRNELWRLAPAAFVIAGAYLGGIFILVTYLKQIYGQWIAVALLQHMANGDTPGAMLLMLWTFVGLAIGPMVAVRLVNHRSAATLFGPSPKRVIADFSSVALPIVGLHVGFLLFVLGAKEIQPGVSFTAFLVYLPFALPAILIQTGAEEIVFRGYLQQQLAARFDHPAIWMGIPSALFAWGHYLPGDYGANAWAVALWALVFGLLAADLTARSGTLGAAMGFHFANNLSALLLVGLNGDMDGLALWTLKIDIAGQGVLAPALTLDFAVMFVSWLLARLSLRV